MADILEHGTIASCLKHVKVEATNGFTVAPCLPQGTVLVSGVAVGQTLLISALDSNSCPKMTLTMVFPEEVRTFAVHSSARFVAVTLENKNLSLLSLMDINRDPEAQAGRISGFKVLHTLTAPKKVTAMQWTDAATLIYSDKFGNIFAHTFVLEEDVLRPEPKEPSMPLGHYSVVTDMLMIQKMGSDARFVVTSDKDEKIRVSRWPHSYDAICYCMGHTQYITSLCLVQNPSLNLDLLISSGGDGQLFGWNYETGAKLFQHHVQVPESAGNTSLRSQFNAANTSISNVLYHASKNLLFVSVEFSDVISIFQLSSASELKLLTTVSVPIIPIKLSVDPLAQTLWISGVPTSASQAPVQVYDVLEASIAINTEKTAQMFETCKFETHKLSAEATKRSFVIHALEDNLKKMQAKRGGVPHAGTYKAEPATKKKVTEV